MEGLDEDPITLVATETCICFYNNLGKPFSDLNHAHKMGKFDKKSYLSSRKIDKMQFCDYDVTDNSNIRYYLCECSL